MDDFVVLLAGETDWLLAGTLDSDIGLSPTVAVDGETDCVEEELSTDGAACVCLESGDVATLIGSFFEYFCLLSLSSYPCMMVSNSTLSICVNGSVLIKVSTIPRF